MSIVSDLNWPSPRENFHNNDDCKNRKAKSNIRIYINISDKKCPLFDTKICISGLVLGRSNKLWFRVLNFYEPAVSHEEPGAAAHSSVDQDVLFEPILSTCHYLLKVMVFMQKQRTWGALSSQFCAVIKQRILFSVFISFIHLSWTTHFINFFSII